VINVRRPGRYLWYLLLSYHRGGVNEDTNSQIMDSRKTSREA
jgi:hypothetical protein